MQEVYSLRIKKTVKVSKTKSESNNFVYLGQYRRCFGLQGIIK